VHTRELTGRVLDGKYVLGPVIGRGAMGRIYRAKQISLEREVAIKVLNPGYSNHPEAIARFRLEARAASRIRHPGIVTILDWGKDPDGLLYLVIEYLPGRDLFDLAQKEAPIESARIARLMQQVALALAHAHSEGVIHRDLKPENLRVLEDPAAPVAQRERVKIYDFGVAHVTQGLARVLTQVGVLVGTPYYMSPEQAASARVLPQSDLYSCGIIMFLLATGTLPFVAPSPVDVAAMHLKKRPIRPSVINPDIDPRLETIILCCLSKDPWLRPASGAELAAMLDPIASPLAPASPGADARRERHGRGPSRFMTAWAVGATAALIAVVGAQLGHGGVRGVASACTSPHCAPPTRPAVAPVATPHGDIMKPEIVERPVRTGANPPEVQGAPVDLGRIRPFDTAPSVLGPTSVPPGEKL